MTSKNGSRFTSKNNVQNVYIQEIDRAIIDVLSRIEKMNYGQLKKEVEKRCERTIPPKTWSTHLKTMQRENYLLKQDTWQRTQPVYYSLTEYARQLRDLKILRMDPQRVVFLQIYANLFSGIIIEGDTYVGDDLEDILNEIHTSREELCIAAIKKKSIEYEEYEEKPELTTVPERRLRTYTAIYYKPTSLGVKIIESTSYRENIFYKNRVEYTAYTYTVPGVSIEDMTHKYYTFNPCLSDCEAALELLLRRDIILPIMDFRGKTRYVIADPALTNFVNELYLFCELENEFLNSKWQYLGRPTFNEEHSRKALYSDETKAERFFTFRGLQRHQFKQAMKNKNNNDRILKVQNELDKTLQEFEKLRTQYTDYLKKKFHSTIDRYPFLREIIQIISPSLSEISRMS
jgi:hypothetical protein